jgi:mannosyltransferase
MPDTVDGRFLTRGSAVRTTLFSALILFGCGLRFWKIRDVGLWYDELWTVVGASNRPFTEMYREWILGDSHPPGYFLFYFAWLKVVPPTEFWARLPNAIAGVLTIAYLLFGTRRVLSRDERILAASFASLSYVYIFYALTVKQYSVMLLLVTIATVTYLEVVRTRQIDRRAAITLAATCIALAYLNHLAMVYATMLIGMLLVTFRRHDEVRRRTLRIALAYGLGYAPVSYFLYIQLKYNIDAWQPYQIPVFLANLGTSFFFDDPSFLALALGILCTAMISRAVVDPHVREQIWSSRTRHLLMIVTAFGGFMLALGAFEPIFYVRYFLALGPAAVLGLAIVTAATFPIERGWLAVLPLVFFAHSAIVQFRSVDGLQREQWDKSVDYVLASRPPADAIYVLGANMDRTEFDYLKAGDVDGVFNVRNLTFYRYYFRRRGATGVAAALTVIDPTVESVRQLAARFRHTSATIYVLAGHNVQYGDDALATLQQVTRRMEITRMNSTLVYKLTF